VAHLEHVANVFREKHQQLALLADHQIARLQLHDRLIDYGDDRGEHVHLHPPGWRQDVRRGIAGLLEALVEEPDDARHSSDVELEHRPEHDPSVCLLRARLAHIGDQVRLLAVVCGQGVAGLDPGAAIDFVDHHVNNQVELVRCAPNLNDLEFDTPHHVDLDAVAVTHVGLLAVRRDANQLACPPSEQLDEHGFLVGDRVVVEVRHGDQVQVVQDVVHADTDVDVKEHRAAMLAAIKRQCKRPHIIARHDIVDDL